LIGRLVENTTAAQTLGRAWSILGPYGGGKSSFALFLAHLLHGDTNAFAKLEDSDTILSEKFSRVHGGEYCPILVVGAREPFTKALLKGLIWGCSSFLATYAKRVGRPNKKTLTCRNLLYKIIEDAQEVLSNEVTDEIVVDLYQRTAFTINEATGGGLLLIVDELGKLLEYAALYPYQSDLYVLQSLAERASRYGVTPDATAPMILVTISHQSFDRYAGVMSVSQQDEWRKIQGRFEDFAFIEPISETLKLLSKAVHVDDPDTLPDDGPIVINQLLKAITLPAGVLTSDVRHHLLQALPLHPAVSLIVGPLFRRLAQNERSLFAFLSSGEPNSFLDVFPSGSLESNKQVISNDYKRTHPLRYRIDHLYDYIICSIGAALFNQNMGKLWAETESVLSRMEIQDEISVRCIKQIAMLNFAGSLTGLCPTIQVLYATLDAPRKDVDSTLQSLKNDRLINYRSFTEEYHIWQGSDFNIDTALEKAHEKIPTRTPIAKLLSSVIPPTPIVARRHSFCTGTNRVFKVHYASTETWQELVQIPQYDADGRIIYVLADHDTDLGKLLTSFEELDTDSLTLVAIPNGVSVLHGIVHRLSCLEWVRSHDKQLQGDAVARQEVDQQLADMTNYVEQRLELLLVPDGEGGTPCTWIYQGKLFYPKNYRSIQEKLSNICDTIFSSTPRIRNELINRHKPSSSAVVGLKMLLEAMLNHENAERLNIEKYPPEYGMYTSILQSTGIHSLSDETTNRWHFIPPDSEKHPGCASVWNQILDTLKESDGHKVDVEKIYNQLRIPPFGMRDGLMPIFLFAVYITNRDKIAIYENGTFISKIEFENIERFLKNSENFQLQLVTIEGARVQLLHHLAPLLGLPKSTKQPLPFVLRILTRIHELPPYVRRTSVLSKMALDVREVLHRAVEPTTLLFEDLPEACEVRSFLANDYLSEDEVLDFSKNLLEALRELSEAYENLLSTLQRQIALVFGLNSKSPNQQRHELASRAHLLLPHTSDMKLKAFLVRVTEDVLDTQGWYESIASLLAQRSPAQWRDEDNSMFTNTLHEVARTFNKLEPIAFEINQNNHKLSEMGTQSMDQVRLSVTMRYQDEHEQVISVHPEDDPLIEKLYQRLKEEIDNDKLSIETKIVAMAKLSNELLAQREKITTSHE